MSSCYFTRRILNGGRNDNHHGVRYIPHDREGTNSKGIGILSNTPTRPVTYLHFSNYSSASGDNEPELDKLWNVGFPGFEKQLSDTCD